MLSRRIENKTNRKENDNPGKHICAPYSSQQRSESANIKRPKNHQELHSALQRLGIPPDLPNQQVFRITAVRGKGQGWKALRDIQPGTPLLGEEVLFWVLEGSTVNERDHPEFSALSCPGPDAVTPQRRFDANCFEMGKDRKHKKKSGIFPQASRINHSCIPNAYFTWNPKLGRSGLLTVYAIVLIPKSAEILVNYRPGDSLENRDHRHESRDYYGFTCTCKACDTDTSFAMESEERRNRMKDLAVAITATEDQDPSNQTTESLRNIIEMSNLLQVEGLLYPDLADAYHSQALWWCREGKRDQSSVAEYQEICREQELQAARKELDLDVTCNGHDSPRVRKTLDFMSGK